MALDLTLGEAVRAASGALFVPFGLFVLTRRHESPRALPLGLFLITFGPGVALANITFREALPDTLVEASSGLLLVIATFATMRLAVVEAREKRRGALLACLAAAALAIIGAVLSIADGLLLFILAQDGSQANLSVLTLRQGTIFVTCSMVGVYASVAAMRARTANATEARALAALATGLALYPLAFFLGGNPSAIILLGSAIATIPLFVAIVAWARATDGAAPLAARAAYGLMVGLSILAVLDILLPTDIGTLGILRVIALGIIAYAVFSADALGPSLRPTSDRRAALLTAFLVILLIVAQIAQNFLSAQYGLVMGGVVAGAIVVAASPIQRAMDRVAGQAQGQAQAQGRGHDARAEDLFRENLRLVLQDRRVTPEEEQHLAELGERLGIGARRAVALRHEVEREKGVR